MERTNSKWQTGSNFERISLNESDRGRGPRPAHAPRFCALVVLKSATTIYGQGSFGVLCLLSRQRKVGDGPDLGSTRINVVAR